ncbi:TetR/AcrR family transcriptional regulator [Alcaligenaceae bacterium]|nr:TetR/AcrR family transcriptional regulator [Alcaligenaceae bacterium]
MSSRALILDTAAELFSTLGYAGTGVRQIANAVGIQPASVYHHFTSKDRILEEVLRIGLTQTLRCTRDTVEVLPAEANCRDKVEAAIDGHLRGIYTNLAYTATNIRFHGQMPVEVGKRLRPLRDGYSDYWRVLLQEAAGAGFLQVGLDVSMARALILGGLNRTVAWFDLEKGELEPLIHTAIVTYGGIWTKNRALKVRAMDRKQGG